MSTETKTAVKCKVCGETVEYPDFKCKKQPGKHTVEPRTYYHLGASHIQSMRDRQLFSPLVILKPGYERMSADGSRQLDRGIEVKFERGMFSTEDPEEQYYLDRRQFPYGDEGLKQWRNVFLTPEQNTSIVRAELADLNRKIEEGRNTLLEQTKKSKQQVSA